MSEDFDLIENEVVIVKCRKFNLLQKKYKSVEKILNSIIDDSDLFLLGLSTHSDPYNLIDYIFSISIYIDAARKHCQKSRKILKSVKEARRDEAKFILDNIENIYNNAANVIDKTIDTFKSKIEMRYV